jgi:3-mercaptopyruvate sulfurtransferase SseA
VRSKEEFDKFTLPGATHAALNDLNSPQIQEFLLEESEEKKDLKVFFSNDNIDADKAWMLFKRMGYDDFVVLKGGLNQFVEYIFHSTDGPKPVNQANPQAIYNYRFKNSARDYFQGLEKEVKTTDNSEAPVMNTITVSGGC